MSYTPQATVIAKIIPLAKKCQYTLADLVAMTGYDAPQIRKAWHTIKIENGGDSLNPKTSTDLIVGVDPVTWIYMITTDPHKARRIIENRQGDSLTRVVTNGAAFYRP